MASSEPTSSLTPINGGGSGNAPSSAAGGAAPSAASSSSSAWHRSQPAKLEEVASRALASGVEPSKRLAAIQEIREYAEVYQNHDYLTYVRVLVEVSTKTLDSIKPSFRSDAPEQRIRFTLLDLIRRLPNFDVVRKYAKIVIPSLLKVLKEDNEDNGELAIKVATDVFKVAKEECEEFALPFFDLIKGIYSNMKGTADALFGSASNDSPAAQAAPSPADPSSQSADPASALPGSSGGVTKTLPPIGGAFKVLSDCPIAIVLLITAYPEHMKASLNSFASQIFDGCLLVEAQPQRDAHEAAKAKGEPFIGVAAGIKNRTAFSEMVHAQIKAMSFLAYVIKSGLPAIKDYAPILPGISIRFLEDCPPEATAGRKELLVAVRHILGTELRSFFASQIDVLLDDRVLLGTGVTSRELQRPLAISMLADLIHHSRAELSGSQLARIVKVHSRILHDPTLAPAIQTMCAKLLLNLVEAIVNHDKIANDLLRQILDAFIEKMRNLPRYKEDWEIIRKRREQRQDLAIEHDDVIAIERSKPIFGTYMLYDHRESDVLKDVLFLLRNLFTGFKTLLALLKRRNAPEPDAETFGVLFCAGVDCWSLIDHRDTAQEKEMMDLFIPNFYDLSPPVFHEVFTTHLPFLYERMLTNNALMGVPQNLLSMNNTSRRFVGIVLRFLADRLEELGDADRKNATVLLRLFKLAFMAVTIYPEENETMLQPHLGYFIMHSMELAAKAQEPSNYFVLLRALFRSIGGGKFELLYKDVLPLLPVMLESLHAFMDAAEPPQRETFVDLCLTVPVRLSALLPFLSFLMRPLVLALRSSGELLSQGLRTLELCIDNLTQEFLDPIMAPYQSDIMNALWEHLQPLPHPHAHSHTTMRILGKMGGRNRKILQQPPNLKWKDNRDAGSMTIHLSGQPQAMKVKPVVDLAFSHVRRGEPYYRQHSWELLKHTAALYADGSLNYNQQPKEAAFEKLVQGLFEAVRVDEFTADAKKYILDLSVHVFSMEAKRFTEEPTARELPAAGLAPLTSAFLCGVVESMGNLSNDKADLEAYTDIILEMLNCTKDVCKLPKPSTSASTPSAVASDAPTLWLFVIKRLSSKLCGLGYDKLWARKTGAWTGLDALIRRAGLPNPWLRDNALEIVRALVFVLKDMPSDPPRNADAVGQTLLYVLEYASTPPADLESQPAEAKTQWERQKENQQTLLIGALVGELASANAMVRSVARDAFRLLARLRGQSVNEVLTSVKDRLLGPIFSKPLRALPFGMQIGHIDAINFCLELDPPLPAFNEELFRVLTEACALADADDAALVGRTSQYKNTVAVTNLRVVAIRLLNSAMNRPEFQGPQHQDQRLRIISMYFKCLYSRSEAVVEVAFNSLKDTLQDSSKLPKDVLRTGLSPILQTLADASKLTVVGLDGLALLLKLLTTYFKVEIGGKLLSHMQVLTMGSSLETAANGDLEGPKYAHAHHLLQSRVPRDSDVIETLCGVVRVFPLLPAAAVQFMEQLVAMVIQVETVLNRTGMTPFIKPLATYLNNYPAAACDTFTKRLEDPRYARLLRLSVLIPEAGDLRAELTRRREKMILGFFTQSARPKHIPVALQLIKSMLEINESWLHENNDVMTAIRDCWKSAAGRQRRREEVNAGPNSEVSLMLQIFRSYLARTDNVDLYFELLEAFTEPGIIDMTMMLRFCYQRVAIEGSLKLKRETISKWIGVLESREHSQMYKTQALRVFVNPILFATPKVPKDADEVKSTGTASGLTPSDKEAAKPDEAATADVEMKDADAEPTAPETAKAKVGEPLFDSQLFNDVLNRVWKPFQTKLGFQLCNNDAHRVELLHMSTMTLEHCWRLLISQGGPRRETIKFGWAHIPAEDVTIKNAAYVFISKFLEYCESPMKIVGQVYTGMLRTEKTEGKALLRKALDILVPALPIRLAAPTDGGAPYWVRWTKTLLIGESQSPAVLMNIMSVIVRHADQFYPYRETFVPLMAGSISRFASSQSQDSKLLAIDVIEVIVRWEKKRTTTLADEKAKKDGETGVGDLDGEDAASSSRKHAQDGDDDAKNAARAGARKRARIDEDGKAAKIEGPSGDAPASTSSPAPAVTSAASPLAPVSNWSTPKSVRESLVNFLLRLICFSTEAMARGSVGRAFLVYRELASNGFWSICDIKLNIFQRPLMTADFSDMEPFSGAFHIVCNSLQALRVICKDKSDAWFVAHAPQLCKLLEKSVRISHPVVVELTRSILERVFESVPDPPPEDNDAEGEEDEDADPSPAAAHTETKSNAAESKSTHHDLDEVPGIVRTFGDRAITDGFTEWKNPYSSFVVLGAWAKSKPERIDVYLAPLIKALSRFTKEHLVQQPPTKPYNAETQIKLLIMALDLTKKRISHLGEHRRWWLSAAVQLGEKSSSIEVCRFLLKALSDWVLEGTEAFPTVKEKAGLLVKMITFENRQDEELLQEYLDLIHSIYTSPQLARTELTVKLEPAFLLGCRHRNPETRQKFLDVFDKTMLKSVSGRLQYLLGQQSWEHLAESYWMTIVTDLLLGSIDMERPLVPMAATMSSKQSPFVQTMRELTVGSFLKALRRLLPISKESVHEVYVDFFRAAWATLPRKQQLDVTRSLVAILTREYHLRQISRRPNVVQTLLEGAQACRPQPELPPHVVKYLGKTFKAWYTSVDILQHLITTLPREDDSIREATLDAQAEMYAELAEEDYFYGLWRRRCVYAETNAAIAYEQMGQWSKAQIAYENAQTRARTGVLTFTEAEYNLWEDHWVICAQKLQQWDTLTDLAKLEGNYDMLLECAWRITDWGHEKEYLEQCLDSLLSLPTPRRKVFAAVINLLKQDRSIAGEFGAICDEAIQLSLRKWHSLPSTVTQAHVPLLQIFQQFVELQEASTVFMSLSTTNATNIDSRSQDLKSLMSTWRERLPNLWDDINAWSDLVAWRQHVFLSVNKAYTPLIPHLQQPNGGQGSSTNSYAYRGYHEQAWIINRFAHVARKHGLNEACIHSLTRIYTLPNIEIQEAFLKLREQAKCHFGNPSELPQGLDVINNTNLMFFAAPQKAEFFTLKGMFMQKLGLMEDANHAFATAIQMDLNHPKAWLEWGRYNEHMMRENPNNGFFAGSAMSSYLQAASLFKNGKVRKILVRVLWLLSNEKSQIPAIAAFESFRGEHPTWYWISFIPQLLAALNHREVVVAKRILISIAKSYPQALYFPVRTTREEYNALRRNLAMHRAQQARQQMAQAQAQAQAQASQTKPKEEGTESSADKSSENKEANGSEAAGKGQSVVETPMNTDAPNVDANGETGKDNDPQGDPKSSEKETTGKADESAAAKLNGDSVPASSSTDSTAAAAKDTPAGSQTPAAPATASTTENEKKAQGQQGSGAADQIKPATPAPAANSATTATPQQNSLPDGSPSQSSPQPWDHADVVLNVLKTAFPLMALTMENMAEQIVSRFKATPEEDLHRLMSALLSEALQQYVNRATVANDDGKLPTPTRQNLMRFSENLHRSPLRSSFEDDFIKSDLTLRECVQRLQQWRDRYETAIDRRPVCNPLEHCSHYLTEFQHLKFDEVEVPGQYLGSEDNNSDFVKIARFNNTYEVVRTSGTCIRRLTMVSNKGIKHSFAVQLNTPRHCRREERTMQLLRCLNGTLEKRIQTRKRGLTFHLPAAIPLAIQARLIENDSSFTSLQDIYEDFCKEVGMGKDDPLMLWVEKLKSTWGSTKGLVEIANLRMDLLDEISAKMVPETVLSNFMTRSMASPEDLWLMRKQFTLQTATTMFLSYVFYITSRTPSRIHISRERGLVFMSDLLPSFNMQSTQFKAPDATPFRLTPNMQHFIGPVGVEGLLVSSLMAIARALTEPEGKLEDLLGIFVKDDLPRDANMAAISRTISEVAKRAKLLCGGISGGDLSCQVVLDLINSSTASSKLALQDPLWAPWI